MFSERLVSPSASDRGWSPDRRPIRTDVLAAPARHGPLAGRPLAPRRHHPSLLPALGARPGPDTRWRAHPAHCRVVSGMAQSPGAVWLVSVPVPGRCGGAARWTATLASAPTVGHPVHAPAGSRVDLLRRPAGSGRSPGRWAADSALAWLAAGRPLWVCRSRRSAARGGHAHPAGASLEAMAAGRQLRIHASDGYAGGGRAGRAGSELARASSVGRVAASTRTLLDVVA